MRVLIAGFVLICFTAVVHAEKRVALVIGNASYKMISPLSNPKNDAELMASTLREVGFEVVTAIDVDRRGMGRAVRKFGKALRRSGKDAVGLLYFAGHGVQANGQNYLIPLGAQIEDTADLDIEAMAASDMLLQMESAGNRMNLIVLDACRNNPFKGAARSTARGLVRIQAASGSLIAFAAAPGQIAKDGTGRNSPYTASLVEAIRQPGLSVEQVFKRTRVSVEKATGGAQTPWEESSLTGEFFFSGRPVAPPPAQPPVPVARLEVEFWNTVRDSTDPKAFEAYLKQFPGGTFASLAKLKLASLSASGPEEQEAKPPAADLGKLDKRTMTLKVQQELERLGCSPGRPDGAWGRRSAKALRDYVRHSDTRLAATKPSVEMLNELLSRSGRVCPLRCGPRYRNEGNNCVLKTCPSSQTLNKRGKCVSQNASKNATKNRTTNAAKKSKSRTGLPPATRQRCIVYAELLKAEGIYESFCKGL